MKFTYEVCYDDFTDWPYGDDVWEVEAEVEACSFIKGNDGRHGHPDLWEPPTCNEVEEIWVCVNGEDVSNMLTQNAIDRLKEKAWDLYFSVEEGE